MNTTGSNSTLLYPPDTPFNIWFCVSLNSCFTVWTIVNIVLVILRRNYQPIKARYVPVILFYQVIIWLVCAINAIRLAVGRYQFPCLLYTATYCVAIPTVFLPHIVRCYRLFLIFKLSYFKTTLQSSDTRAKAIRIITRLISGPVIAAVMATLLAISVALWLLVVGIVSISQPKYFTFTDGCGLGAGAYLVLALVGIYLAVDFLFICLLIRGVRDNYGIRYEVFIVSAAWVLFLIVFAIMYFVPAYAAVYEYHFAAGYILFFGFCFDSFVSCTLPCLLTFRKVNDYQQVSPSDEVSMVLMNEKYREAFKTYAISSFCPETILCWEDVQAYYQLESTPRKLSQIKKILDKYCDKNSILELNLPSHMHDYIKRLAELVEKSDESTELKPDELELLRIHCEQDLMDVFARFKMSEGGKEIEKQKEITKEQDILMKQTGIMQ